MAKARAPSNLVIRFATAGVVAPLLIALIYKGPAWGFFVVVLFGAMLGVWELLGMTHGEDTFSRALGVIGAGAASTALYFGGHDSRVIVTVLLVVPLAGPMIALLRLGDLPTAALRSFALSIGPLVIALPLTTLALLRRDMGPDGPGYVILALVIAWIGDTGGYFAGRFWGRHKLYEAVSPKKTTEGALGSLFGSVIGGALVAHYWYLPSLPLAHAIPLALVAGAFGQAGDLSESLIKRSTGVKDSGNIIPGHGGILDRVDALILTSTVVYLYTLWFQTIPSS